VLDSARDAYDQAFVLFALAWYFRATGNADAIDMADLTYAFMTERLADPRYGGFLEQYVPGLEGAKLPRRQNPHMHLLEALLALYEATGDSIWLQRSEALVELFKTRFVDRETGALIEFFAEDWSPAAGLRGQIREPGHQFEWVWLLFAFFRHSRDESVLPYAERLYRFGAHFGVDREAGLRGAVFDEVDAQGEVIADTKLLWPQTEFVKACAARWEWLRDEEALRAMQAHLVLIARHYMRADGAAWHNQLARDGTPIASTTAARLLYHLFLAMAEADRVLSPDAAPRDGFTSPR
jgi:mannose/cellobiose epimerase-like protein (N-acyl-D-glucosamine 2-epimerase family)